MNISVSSLEAVKNGPTFHEGQLGMTTLNIQLDGQLEADLREAVARRVRRQDFAREALRRQLALVRLDALQKELVPYAQACGWFTDDDVIREVS